MLKYITLYLPLLLVLTLVTARAQASFADEVTVEDVEVEWLDDVASIATALDGNDAPAFQNSVRSNKFNSLPHLVLTLDGPIGSLTEGFLPLDQKWEAIPASPEVFMSLLARLPAQLEYLESFSSTDRRVLTTAYLLPVRFNQEEGKIEILRSFSYNYRLFLPSKEATLATTAERAPSPLAKGEWYKVSVQEDGIYKIDRALLVSMGADGDALAGNIRVYGAPGGLLPKPNNAQRDTILTEVPVLLHNAAPDQPLQGGSVCFYAEGPVKWDYDSSKKTWQHQPNHYSDYSYYFITTTAGPSTRVGTATSSNTPDDLSLTQGTTLRVHNHDTWSEIAKHVKSGSTWYDTKLESYDNTNPSQSASFNIPNKIAGAPVTINLRAAARSTQTTGYKTYINGQAGESLSIGALSDLSTAAYTYANAGFTSFQRATGAGDELIVKAELLKSTQSTVGWLDYIEVIAPSALDYKGNTYDIRIPHSTSSVASFTLNNGQAAKAVWDVTDFHQPRLVQADGGTSFTWAAPIDEPRRYIVWNGEAMTPGLVERVKNQDMRSLGSPDMFIVAHPLFLPQAEKIANYHRQNDALSVAIITPQQVYNDFSSGRQDPAALRDMMRFYYEKAATAEELPHYLLLLGDASYDPKDRIPNNTNYITSYMNPSSINSVNSFISDDFYGCLDPDEGNWPDNRNREKIDLAIGRLPVNTTAQADGVTAKILRYHSKEALGDWRNNVVFVADDEDNNTHINQAEKAVANLTASDPWFNVKKLYLDAYKQEQTANGAVYPLVTEALTRQVRSGALTVTWIGHGYELGLAHERLVTLDEINKWDNFNKLPLFVTGTCEFSRYDDPERISAGEQILLKPDGGGIAMFTTTRVVYISDNNKLTQDLYASNLVSRDIKGGKPLGDIIKDTKNSIIERAGSFNNANFTLLGDPALRLAVPRYKVFTTYINKEVDSTTSADTLKALSTVTIKGYIGENSGKEVSSFNGTLFPLVYDKERTMRTLANDRGSYVRPFEVDGSIVYQGTTEIKDGQFEFSFVVPKDIIFESGSGRLSYYAKSADSDAHGSDTNIIIGGIDTSAGIDDQPPVVNLYIDDINFRDGGITGNTPTLLVHATDDRGINLAGIGRGHELTVRLNGGEPVVLNSLYRTGKGANSGELEYNFSYLVPGTYAATVKVWDVANNSTEETITFKVVDSREVVMENLYTYPNPVVNEANISFEHNQPGKQLDITMTITNLAGQQVLNEKRVLQSTGSRTVSMKWDGNGGNGAALVNGLYLLRIEAQTSEGSTAALTTKVLLLR